MHVSTLQMIATGYLRDCSRRATAMDEWLLDLFLKLAKKGKTSVGATGPGSKAQRRQPQQHCMLAKILSVFVARYFSLHKRR
jgi:hypothetical protein